MSALCETLFGSTPCKTYEEYLDTIRECMNNEDESHLVKVVESRLYLYLLLNTNTGEHQSKSRRREETRDGRT